MALCRLYTVHTVHLYCTLHLYCTMYICTHCTPVMQGGSVALWRLLDYIDLYRTPLYTMMLSFIRGRERVSPGQVRPLIGREGLSDLNTDLSLVESDHVT